MGTILSILMKFASKIFDSLVVEEGSWHRYGETNHYLFPPEQSRSESFQMPMSAELENLNLGPFIY